MDGWMVSGFGLWDVSVREREREREREQRLDMTGKRTRAVE